MRVAVLGASGFVGSAVLAALAERPVAVRAVSRRPCAIPGNSRAEFESRRADLTIGDELRAAVAGADAVLHLLLPTGGWRAEGAETEPVNVGVMRRLAGHLGETRARPPVVVFAGSVSQVGRVQRLPIDGTEPDQPEGPYERQKLAAERMLERASAAGTLRGISLRLPTVYGSIPGTPCADRGVVATMARRALAGEPLTMWGDGSVQRDLIHVRDVADAFVAALRHPDRLAGRHWIVGSGTARRLRDVFEDVAEAVSRQTGRPPLPVVPVEPPGGAQAADMNGVATDPSSFREATGWRPRVPFPDGLDRLVAALAADG